MEGRKPLGVRSPLFPPLQTTPPSRARLRGFPLRTPVVNKCFFVNVPFDELRERFFFLARQYRAMEGFFQATYARLEGRRSRCSWMRSLSKVEGLNPTAMEAKAGSRNEVSSDPGKRGRQTVVYVCNKKNCPAPRVPSKNYFISSFAL